MEVAAERLNPSSHASPDGLHDYGYTPAYRLDTAMHPSGSPALPTSSEDFDYDPFGRRYRKTVNGVSTYFLWDGDDLLAEYDGSGIRRVRYVSGPGYAPLQVAYNTAGTETIYDVHTDPLDTPKLLTDQSGTIVWRSRQLAYGATVVDDSQVVGDGVLDVLEGFFLGGALGPAAWEPEHGDFGPFLEMLERDLAVHGCHLAGVRFNIVTVLEITLEK